MTDPDFPDDLRAFIRDHIPDVDSAELLLLLARNSARELDVSRIVAELRPTVVTEATVRKHLAVFHDRGLVAQPQPNVWQYRPSSPAQEELVHALLKVYNERPVTMVRMIYTLRDEKIRSFADAFRLKKS